MTHPCRRPLAAAAVLSLSVVLGACGSGNTSLSGPSGSASPSASASSSPTGASASPSSTETTATSEPTPAASGPTPVSAAELTTIVDAALDDTSAAHLVVENGLGFLNGEGDVDFRETPSSLAMTLTSNETGDSQQVVVQIIGSTMFLQDGQGFLKVDIDSPSNPFGSSLSDQLDPRTVMDAVEQHLVSASTRGTVEDVGETLDVYRAVAEGPALLQQLAPELAAQDDVVVPATVRCDLTVDSEGHARSITVDLGEENGQLAYQLSDWRTDVSIEAPPAAQVSDLPDLG